MDDELGTSKKPPLTGGHLPIWEMGIMPPPVDKVMDVCSIMFDKIKKRIVKQRHRYFPKDLQIQSQIP